MGSIDIALIPPLAGEGDDPVLGLRLVQLALGHGDAAKGGVDVFRHAAGIAADVEMAAFLQPAPQICAALRACLSCTYTFCGLVPGEGGVETRQGAVGDPGFQLVAEQEVGGLALVAEEQPGAAA